MIHRLPPLSALRAFEAAARHLSFKRAAAELCVSPAAISQQIKALEGYLERPLFRRGPRGLALSESGEAMVQGVREGLERLAGALAAVRGNPSGPLAVHAPPSFAQRWLLPRLPRFRALHPEVDLRLVGDAGNIDAGGRGQEAVQPAPPEAGVVVAVRFGMGGYPGGRGDTLLVPEYVLVCSPALLAGPRGLRTPAGLAEQTLLHDESIPDVALRPHWSDWLERAGVTGVDVQRGPRFSNSLLVLEAVLGGQGVALALRQLVEADLAAGRLVTPFETVLPSRYVYSLVVPEATVGHPGVQAFREWLLAEARSADGGRVRGRDGGV